jgi:hypothetical protein
LEHDNQNGDSGEVLAAPNATAFTNWCLARKQKPFGIALDTADFVRHVPGFPPGFPRVSQFASDSILIFIIANGSFDVF